MRERDCHSDLERMLLFGGLICVSLARLLSAARRASLYGSRMDTQRLGTVKLAAPCGSRRSNLTLSGCWAARRRSFSRSFGLWV